MKIQKLSFKNLNSLYGQWSINFTHPDYVNSGIFALTGPTGAGKSTIFDAVCLAFYGSTPRLNKISGENEIMSRNTYECFSEVVFETGQGVFRIKWSQRRSNKKVDGKLQNPSQQLSDEKGNIISNKITEITKWVNENTGMDFEKFTRSIMLSQGSFDSFLNADEKEKSRLLEQITGTKIYSEIGKKVYLFNKENQDDLKVLAGELKNINLLDSKELKGIENELIIMNKKKLNVNNKIQKYNEGLRWLNEIQQINAQINDLLSEESKVIKSIDDFKENSEKLAWAEIAVNLDETFAILKENKKEQDKNLIKLEDNKARFKVVKKNLDKIYDELKKSTQQKEETQKNNKKIIPLIQNVRLLDNDLKLLNKNILEAEKDYKNNLKKIEQNKDLKQRKYNNKKNEENEFELVGDYLEKNAQDKWLIKNLTGIKEKTNNLISLQRDIKEIQKLKSELFDNVQKLEDDIQKHKISFKEKEQEINNISANIKQNNTKIQKILNGKTLREIREKKENFLRELVLIKKIESLEDERKKLKEGESCPLCGSKEHPFVESVYVNYDDTESKIDELESIINEVEKYQKLIDNKENKLKSERKNLNKIEIKKNNSHKDNENLSQKIKELQDGIAVIFKKIQEVKENVANELKPMNIENIQDRDFDSLLKELQRRQQMWISNSENYDKYKKSLENIEKEIKNIDEIIEIENDYIKEKKEKYDKLKEKFKKLKIKRKNLFGNKDPDVQERNLNKLMDKALSNHEKLKKHFNKESENFNILKSNIEEVENRIKDKKTTLNKINDKFNNQIKKNGFENEKDFIQKRLSPDERKKLSDNKKILENKKLEIELRKKEKSENLTSLKNKKVTDKNISELNELIKQNKLLLNSIDKEVIKLNVKISENEKFQKKFNKKKSAISKKEKEVQKWQKLNKLIGSKEGDKFRSFAQGITFDLIISHANRQLEKMTDRYFLLRGDKGNLNLSIIDEYQGGEIRSIRNLSGGESFVVSLTLALGLSEMLSQKVYVNSLFLDEGFGTLDEEFLETALKTLSELKHDEKLICVISHIPALKDRIPIQINISPSSNGKSIINGPGVE
ncbi:MAG: AAA family ATPase [Candidatus Muiribacteriota bacterium]